MRLLYPFANRLAAPVAPGERLRVERMLAGARLFLALVTSLIVFLDPTQPSRYANLTYALMAFYVGHSVAIIIVLRGSYEVTHRFVRTMHGIDVLFPALIALFTQGPSSPFFFIFFPLLAAAFRWGFRATFFTALTGVGLLISEAVLFIRAGGAGPLVEGRFDVKYLMLRSTYILMMGLLMGYAAEEEKQLRAENMTISRLTEKVRSAEGRLSATIQDVFDELIRIFNASCCAAVLRDTASGRVFLWSAQRVAGSQQSHLQLLEPEFNQREALLVPVAGAAWHAMQGENGNAHWQVTAIEPSGRRLRVQGSDVAPIDYPGFGDCRSLLGVSFNFGESWTGRMLIFDPQLKSGVETELRFAQNLLQQVGPAIYNLYLVRKLRSRAGAIERARAARELHDGAIQTLISAEMQVDVVRRKAQAASYPISDELDRIQQILRQEVLGLRELMQQMKPVDVSPHDVLDFLAETVDRFRRDTGIEAKFVSEQEEVPLSSRVCRELVRITQEALVNVRKHSGATSVLVRLMSEGGRWKLMIEDDGRGFVFIGRFSGAELQAKHQGPLVIRERVRSIGGELIVDSAPGRGARIEIAVPQQARATYA